MKRDMDLCRKILLEVESWKTTLGPQQVEIDGYTEDEVGYHGKLLADAGLVEGQDVSGLGMAVHHFWPRCLTWQGHEFLDAARNDDRWEQAKQMMTDKASGFSLEVLQALLIKLGKKALGLDGE